jgi:hypothetical protein
MQVKDWHSESTSQLEEEREGEAGDHDGTLVTLLRCLDAWSNLR